jgi:predicted nuclease of predicted toxin-antitoxin system
VRLCLDENIRSRELVSRLLVMGHEVVEADLGISDAEVWEFAHRNHAVVVTGNAVDFVPLAKASGHHAGLLLVYRDNDPRRDMATADIATAINNVDAGYGGVIVELILVLNQFRRSDLGRA